MSQNNSLILKLTHIVTWIAFIGLCINAGTIITSYVFSTFVNPGATSKLMLGLDLTALRAEGKVEYHVMVLGIIIVTVLEATLFYKLIQMFQKIDFQRPFHEIIGKLILHMSVISLFVGILSKQLTGFAGNYLKPGLSLPHLQEYIGHGDAFLFFAGILFVIATIFKKGIELQTENELTV
jgi:hypothetical protein